MIHVKTTDGEHHRFPEPNFDLELGTWLVVRGQNENSSPREWAVPAALVTSVYRTPEVPGESAGHGVLRA